MIKQLNIKNLILIDTCELSFSQGFTVFSGETGAGKTAFLEAIRLIAGERADSASIRKGADSASIEAALEVPAHSPVWAILEESGILREEEELLIIRRELHRDGKNRAFINGQMVLLTLLQKVGHVLFEIVDQHSSHLLKNTDYLSSLLDLFAGVDDEIAELQKNQQVEKQTQEKLDALILQDSRSERDLELFRSDLDEIEKEIPEGNREEEWFEEYQKLAGFQELNEKVELLLQLFKGVPGSRLLHTSSDLVKIDAKLAPIHDSLKVALSCLNETSTYFQSYIGNLEFHPSRLAFLEEKLTTLSRLKRKYGDLSKQRDRLRSLISELENIGVAIEGLQKEKERQESTSSEFCRKISQKRKKAAEKLQKQLSEILSSINMGQAKLRIDLEKSTRTQKGEDAIEFWLQTNPGEPPSRVKDSSSGGELARLLFAIKTALAEKNRTPILIFDEIDANVGGKTSAILGQKLRDLGRYRQVFCITHFPQLAQCADHHLSVQKEERNGRTVTQIRTLGDSEKQQELLRMLGGNSCLI